MYLKNSHFAIYLAAAALVGFGASFLLGTSDSQNGLLSGDISKASRYNNVQEDPEMSVVVEKLQNDTSFFNQTKRSIEYLKTRVSSLAVLSEETARLCNDIPELNSNVPVMKSLSVKANNAGSAFDAVSSSLDLIEEGKKAPAYEQDASNAYLGYQKIGNHLEICKEFVESAGKYLEDKDLEENKDLAGVVALWSVYNAQDAVMMGNEENVKYWGDKIASDAVASQALKMPDDMFNNTVKQMMQMSDAMNIASAMQKLQQGNVNMQQHLSSISQSVNPLITIAIVSGNMPMAAQNNMPAMQSNMPGTVAPSVVSPLLSY